MSIEALNQVFHRTPEATGMNRLVLLALANYADADHQSWPSLATIGRCVGTDRRESIRCALRSLETLGLITTTPAGAPKKGQRGGRRTNLYTITRRDNVAPLPQSGTPSAERTPPQTEYPQQGPPTQRGTPQTEYPQQGPPTQRGTPQTEYPQQGPPTQTVAPPPTQTVAPPPTQTEYQTKEELNKNKTDPTHALENTKTRATKPNEPEPINELAFAVGIAKGPGWVKFVSDRGIKATLTKLVDRGHTIDVICRQVTTDKPDDVTSITRYTQNRLTELLNGRYRHDPDAPDMRAGTKAAFSPVPTPLPPEHDDAMSAEPFIEAP